MTGSGLTGHRSRGYALLTRLGQRWLLADGALLVREADCRCGDPLVEVVSPRVGILTGWGTRAGFTSCAQIVIYDVSAMPVELSPTGYATDGCRGFTRMRSGLEPGGIGLFCFAFDRSECVMLKDLMVEEIGTDHMLRLGLAARASGSWRAWIGSTRRQPRRGEILSSLRITLRHRWPADIGYQGAGARGARPSRWRGLPKRVAGPARAMTGRTS